jgi:transposase
MLEHFLTECLGIEGFKVINMKREVRNGQTVAVIDLERTDPTGCICSQCGRKAEKVVKYRSREIQHLRLFQHLTFLRFTQYRVQCPDCGKKAEKLSFTGLYSRVTNALAAHVHELCKVTTVKAVSILQALHWGTVKDIDKNVLQRIQDARPLDGITVLGADEIFVGKGYKCWHLISALEGPRGPELLHIGEGRKEKDLKKFWKWFGKRRAKKVTHAVMDMWKGFVKSFKSNCPNVQIIYDKFHVIRHLLTALNTVRKDELRKAAGRFRGLLPGKKFVLLSRYAHLTRKSREALYEILIYSPKLFKAYLLKETFGHLWDYSSKTWARKFFQSWVNDLKRTRLKPYKRFALMVEKHLDGILSYCDKKVSLGYIEATNLKARNIIRRAYGFRDKQYMKLKIIQACSPFGKFQPWSLSNIPL